MKFLGILQDKTLEKDLKYLYNSFYDAKEYGSILSNNPVNYNKIRELTSNFTLDINLKKFKYQIEIQIFKDIIKQSEILSKNYDVVITNPPYMGNNGMNSNLKEYLKNNFKNTKNDLSTVFMERSFEFAKKNGYISMINIPVWMFISSYEKLRTTIIDEKTFINMLHLGRGIFGSDFGTTAFVLQNNSINDYKSTFKQLYNDKGAVDSVDKKEQMFFNDKHEYLLKQSNFNKIPGNPIAYWISEEFINSFENKTIGDYSEVITGMTTGDNNSYLRFWYEVNLNKICLYGKNMRNIDLNITNWIPYNKGGERRNWYGNNEYIVNWAKKDNFNRAKTTLERLYLKKGLTWSFVTSGKFSMRYFPEGFLWDVSGSPAFFNDDDLMYYTLGFLCTNFANSILNLLNPTINIQAIDIKKVPLVYDENYKNVIVEFVKNNINISKEDWNEKETSWDFKSHYFLLYPKEEKLSLIFNNYTIYKQKQFNYMQQNEEKLNQLFSKIYGVDFEIDISDEDITINIQSLNTSIKSFISYAVGCMFGRYSLDNEGLQFAGGEFNINNYHKFIPDDDNIIPVLDTAYFDDDIVGYFTKFVETCFGSETLEENLDFIAGALSNSNKPSREIIRDYLVKNFFNDHKKTYKKCPIYWQFSSGKQNGFNCLVYMHRYEPSLVARIRTDYLHKTQKAIEQRIDNNNNIINNSSSKQDVAKATKEKAKLQKQLKETQEYDEVLAHIANQNIEIDLDDGVKVNYAKFQNIEIKKEGSKTKKVNLLKKI